MSINDRNVAATAARIDAAQTGVLRRDVAIINARTQAALGPVPIDALASEPKRKPALYVPSSAQAAPDQSQNWR
ncbi:hypothetical protein [Lysobacter gummosus]|uniref:Uncharacterized protein n=1 Tax=Lysobacter gummosus TaxID=262324 RepID=A0ABY3XGB5_9GAMM|nr:hypothetical protein [Lysobacter gummosus]UNP30691.1 hypothetical protein MOV92_05360 [Lysobacter gummosus]